MNLKYRVKRFWDEFLLQHKNIEEYLDDNDQTSIKRILDVFNERLTKITGYKMTLEKLENGFYELSFITQGDKNAQFAASLLKKNAPKELADNWFINPYRPPLSDEMLNKPLQVDNELIYGSDVLVYYEIDEALKCINVSLYSEKFLKYDINRRGQIALSMLELYIGELELEARINAIEVLEKENSEAENFTYLANFYEDLCDIIVDNDFNMYHEPLEIFQVFKLDEQQTSKTIRKDILLLITTNTQLHIELLNNEDQSLVAFNALGGEYGYLYYERIYDDEKEAIHRQSLEKEINKLFYEDMSIARSMGGAIGSDYSYIDVALFDKDMFMLALAKLNEKLDFKIYYHPFKNF